MLAFCFAESVVANHSDFQFFEMPPSECLGAFLIDDEPWENYSGVFWGGLPVVR